MGTVAKFFYDESKFPKMEVPDSIKGQVIDTRFVDFYDNLINFSFSTKDYYVFDRGFVNYKCQHSIEIFSVGKSSDEEDLRNLFSKVLSSDNVFFPDSVSCKKKSHYALIQDALSEVNPRKKLSKGIYEFLFNDRLIIN